MLRRLEKRGTVRRARMLRKGRQVRKLIESLGLTFRDVAARWARIR
jgi:hypothetical protein